MKDKWTLYRHCCRSCLQTERSRWIFFPHVSAAEHFSQRRLRGGDAADHGQQGCTEKAKRCRATFSAGSRLPRLQLPTPGGKCQLMVVSSSIIIRETDKKKFNVVFLESRQDKLRTQSEFQVVQIIYHHIFHTVKPECY